LEIIMADHVTTTLVDGMHFQVAIDEFIIDPEAVQRAINLSEEKYCPVMGMLRASVNLHSRYEVVEV
jgi:uncharacterized OsmC-like protein